MSRASPAAFTLADTLVVLGVMGLLMALSVPALMNIRARADRLRCENNLRQIGIAVHHFERDHGTLPMPTLRMGIANLEDLHRSGGTLKWFAYLLPYIEQVSLWKQAEAGIMAAADPYFDNPPHVGLATAPL